MTTRMLIDATHPEETRVVVVSGNRLEDFDYETTHKTQLKGNIYLAKVTRVEPSLQAAFVDYGGNRHGFLAFSEIHPDYYRIPISDREEILQEEAAESQDDDEDIDTESDDDDDSQPEPVETLDDEAVDEDDSDDDDADEADEANADAEATDGSGDDEDDGEDGSADDDDAETASDSAEVEAAGDAASDEAEASEQEADSAESDESGDDGQKDADPRRASADPRRRGRGRGRGRRSSAARADSGVDTVGGDEIEDIGERRRRPMRRYRIQEVISRRQIILVQVAKEERGNKGAAITSYISLAGRYCVLMPNTPRGGGISRKIANMQDRKRLKKILDEFDIPEGMAVIVRTAGAQRTKAEIRRDYEYLLKLWDEIREKTLESTAPALIHEEANLIKRSIRDLYNKDIDEVLVEGDEGYRTGKDFMKLLMPSHAKRVKQYKEPKIPLFQRYQIEAQIDNIHSPNVQLKSGGYIVLNSTEALVAIDVNSGRATRERNIEETALKTNLEAADEVARQLKLRDLAGLIVIDFIDMEDGRNRHAVERRLKNAMASDRARIQIGRISAFGLLEMSRQRLRPSVIEASTTTCPTCGGTGLIRSTESTALTVLRAIEEEGIRQRAEEITVHVPPQVAFYILNQKRADLTSNEERYEFRVLIEIDEALIPPDHRIEKTVARAGVVDEEEENAAADESSGRRRRRRGGRKRRGEDRDGEADADVEAKSDDSEDEAEAGVEAQGEDAENGRRRSRGRRGGRRRRGNGRAETGADAADEATADDSDAVAVADDDSDSEAAPEAAAAEEETEAKPRNGRRRGGRRRAKAPEEASTDESDAETPTPEVAAETPEATADQAEAEAPAEEPAKPARRRRSRAKPAKSEAASAAEETPAEPAAAEESAEEAEANGSNGSAPAADAAGSEETAESAAGKNDDDAAAEPPAKKRRGWWSIAR